MLPPVYAQLRFGYYFEIEITVKPGGGGDLKKR